LQALHPEQQLALIADKLQEIGDVGERVNIAKSLFGKGGVGMLNVLEKGSKGLQEWQAAAEATGRTFSNLDLKKIERANNTIKVMQSAFKGIAEMIAVELAPDIERLARFIVALGKVGIQFWKDWGSILTWIIKLTIAYRAAVFAVVAVERAWAVVTAIKTALLTDSWAKLTAKLAMVTAAVGAVTAIFAELEKLMGGIKIPGIPEMPGLGGGDDAALSLAKRAGSLHPGAYEKGSTQAYSIIAQSGATHAEKLTGIAKRQLGVLGEIRNNTRKKLPAANLGK